MRSFLLFVFSLLFCLQFSISTASASFIRLLPTVTIELDGESRMGKLAFSIQNDGDETAFDVRFEFPSVNESHAAFADLPPGEKKTFTHEASFTVLGVEQDGTYSFPYRIFYRDAGSHEYSAPHIADMQFGRAPARALIVYFEGVQGGTPIPISSTVSLPLVVRNSLQESITVNTLQAFGPAELIALLRDVELPFTLQAQEKRRIWLDVENAGANELSVYALHVLASGLVGERHFAAKTNVQFEISVPPYSTRNILLLVLGLVILGAFVGARSRNKALS